MPTTPPDDQRPTGSPSSGDDTPTASQPVPDVPRAGRYAEGTGDRIGPFTLVRVLGEGGFGTVWLAERQQPMVQQVALKIIKPGMDSAAVVARFEQERQALAVMDHPNVARVFDGGVTASGRPYFVMEYVQGAPITSFADERKLTLRQRLELFVPVCEAVQHAHHKGLIHRDLKPSNVLVADIEGKPVPKVIDFGVAKAIASSGWENTAHTQSGMVIGTPEYMSPEQVAGELDVDTRADVYSLGVMLYELLTGELPFNSHELRKAALAEVARFIKEVTPPKPSTRLAQLAGERTTTIAQARSATRERITSELRRELDWIPLMALRKERERRYASPQALADDVQRYLEGRPLRAAPDSKAYLVRKFVRRNKVQVFAASAVFLALSAGLAVALWQRSEAIAAKDAEAQRANERDQVARFQSEMVKGVDTSKLGADILAEVSTRLADSVTVDTDRARIDAALRTINRRDLAQTVLRRHLVRAASERVQKDFSGQPRIASRLWSSLGELDFALGDAASAEQSLRLAIEQSPNADSRTDPTVLADRQQLGLTLLAQGQYAEAQALLRQLLTDRTNVFGANAPETAETMASLAEAEFYVGTRAEAQSLLERAAAIFRAADGPDQRREVQAVMTLVGFALDSAGNDPAQLDLASALLNRFPKLIERGPVAAEPVTMLFANYYAGVRLTLADRAERGSPDGARLASEAEALYRALLKAELELQPTDHPAVLSTRFQIARALEIQRRFDEALGLFGLIRELAPGSVGETSPLGLAVSESVAFLLLNDLNRPAEARPIFERLIALSEKPGSSIPPDALADWKEALARATASETGAAAPQSEPQSSPP